MVEVAIPNAVPRSPSKRRASLLQRSLAAIVLAGSALALLTNPAAASDQIKPVEIADVPMFEDRWGNKMHDWEWRTLVMCQLSSSPDWACFEANAPSDDLLDDR